MPDDGQETGAARDVLAVILIERWVLLLGVHVDPKGQHVTEILLLVLELDKIALGYT